MLKNVPRLITIGLLLLFSLPLAIQHFTYLLASTSGQAGSESTNALRYGLHERLEKMAALFSWLERVDYDLHLRSHVPGKIHPDVAVIEVNERSLWVNGQFPFSRKVYQHLLEKLSSAGAKVVAFDITFSEQERNEAPQVLQALIHKVKQREGFDSLTVREMEERYLELDADEAFATALSKSSLPVVLGFTFAESSHNVEVSKETAEQFLTYDVKRRQFSDMGMIHSQSHALPVVPLVYLMRSLNTKGSIGHFNPIPDNDSVIRRVPLVEEYKDRILASLSLRALAAYYGEKPVLDGTDGLAIHGELEDEKGNTRSGQLNVPLTPWGTLYARFYGGNRIFPFTEFSDVYYDEAKFEEMHKGEKKPPLLSDTELKEKFGGKIVFVGVTAVGLKDLRATPFSSDYPGVEVHATVASNVLSQNFILRDQRFFLFGYLFLWVMGALVAWAVYRYHPFRAVWLMMGAVAAIQLASHFFFYNRGVMAPTLLPSLSCVIVFFAGVLYRYFTEEREKKMVRTAFSRYVSGAVVEEILKDQTKLRLGGQKKELTVMFVDLISFTQISEHMDAAFVTQLLNEYFTRMTNILLRNQGTLDKYMGDGIMCFWGAPLENLDHARLACITALEMRAELAKINHEWKLKHNITINNRIGVHTGDMAVGNMGSDQVFSYTVMGDNVNLGSRLEGVNTVYGTNIVVSAATAVKAGPGFLFRPLDRVQVKGKEDAVDILELVSVKQEKEPEWVHAFRTGLQHYQAGEWDDAESAFGACLTLKPGDGPSQVFVDRIHDFRIVEPDEWSGVWKLSSK